MLTKLKNKKEGFTIIEVMIVLAIAGLIILIVLLAIPALQRNGRNTAIKNDASALAAGVSEFKSINDGVQPDGVNKTAGNTNAQFTRTGQTPVDAKVQADTAVTIGTAAPANPGSITVVLQRKCDQNNSGLDAATSQRSVALLYRIETSAGGAGVIRCTDAS